MTFLRRLLAPVTPKRRGPAPIPPEPEPEGFVAGDWIDWPGDRPCPLPPGTLFQPRWRRYHRPAPVCRAGERAGGFWEHCGETLDIVAFRVVVRKREERT